MDSRDVIAIFSIAWAVSGCSTVASPVLRHETGETLGQNALHVEATYEQARLFPAVPVDSAALGQAQARQILQAGTLALYSSYGVTPLIDLEVGGFIWGHGGGWRLGAKGMVFKQDRFAVSLMGGYSAAAGTGNVTYTTDGGQTTEGQSLSNTRLDFGVPVSYRLTSRVMAYGGLNFYHNSLSGTAGTDPDYSSVSSSGMDIGINFGFKYYFDTFDVDLEGAFVKVSDAVAGDNPIVPYFGVGIGKRF